MRKTFLILTLFFITGELLSQTKDSCTYKNSFAINLESIVVGDIKLTYTHRISRKLYLETMLSYNFPLNENYIFSARPAWYLLDPYSYYGRIQIREGLKIYKSKRFYLCPELLYSYGSFNKHEDVIYRPNDVWYIVSRHKTDFELFLKWGWTYHKKNFFHDLYMGIGWRIKLLDDEIYAATGNGPYYGYQYGIPASSKKTSYGKLTFHLGFQIGHCQ